MCNYLFDVRFEDNFRLKLINEQKLKLKKKNNVDSLTDDVISYYLEPTNPMVHYSLTVIDSPGFGDTRGLGMDQTIGAKIKSFFETQITITGVCFTIKASEARLTKSQKYIFSTLLGLFGKDIKDNIFILTTFDDGSTPVCLDALKEAEVPFNSYYQINNSGFNLKKKKHYWKSGMKAFQNFFGEIGRTPDKGLGLTKKVLKHREEVKCHIESLQRRIKSGTQKMLRLEECKQKLNNFKKQMNSNENFEFERKKIITVTKHKMYGQAMVCKSCKYTCHDNCGLSINSWKYKCCTFYLEWWL